MGGQEVGAARSTAEGGEPDRMGPVGGKGLPEHGAHERKEVREFKPG